MNVTWQEIADALRNEAAECGRLIGLFEEQQSILFRRDPQTVLELSEAIRRQADVLDEFRRKREETVGAFATAHGHAPAATLRSLLEFVPTEARPLIEALIAEVNRMIHRTRRYSRQNHRLLACMVECHQEVIRRLLPGAFTGTYASNGKVMMAGLRAAPSMQTAG